MVDVHVIPPSAYYKKGNEKNFFSLSSRFGSCVNLSSDAVRCDSIWQGFGKQSRHSAIKPFLYFQFILKAKLKQDPKQYPNVPIGASCQTKQKNPKKEKNTKNPYDPKHNPKVPIGI